MSKSRCFPVRWCRRWVSLVGLTSVVFGGAALLPASAQSLQITGISLDNAGRPQIRHGGDPASYFVLLRGSELSDLTHAVDARLGVQGAGELRDMTPLRERAFYRVYRLPRTSPLDLDRDGMDDLFELTHAPALSPLNSADALGDADGDDRNNLQEFEAGTDPERADFFVIPSPQHQETGVSVNRETEFRFTVALAESTALDGTHLWAEAGGRRLLARAELSADRKTARLFYLEPVPGLTRVRVSFDGTGLSDGLGRALDLDSDGQPGGVAAIEFTTAALTPVAGTAVIGTVFASELAANPQAPGTSTNRPLAGVTITVDGAEEILRTTTDAQGRFSLSPCPAGRFFVHVDGRTVVDAAAGIQWPNQAYYPFVGKAWEATAGVMTNLAGGTGEIYLPLISSEALRGVSSTAETTVGFPASVVVANPGLAGVEIVVPPNALFADDGTRGGRVGMAPVDPARLPEPLPPGLTFPLVITVQTDGPQNFDQPVPVKFPNLPDPNTGKKLGPGEKSALWSFDHDKGIWEIVGPMTVSADGLYLVSDPGVGIRQPGWHGSNPGTGGNGPIPGPRKPSNSPRPPRPPLTPPTTPPPPTPPGPTPSPAPKGGGGNGEGSPLPDFPELPEIPFIDVPESWGDLVSAVVDQLPTLGPDVFGPIVDIGEKGIDMFDDLGEVIGSSSAADSDGDGVPDVVESRDAFLEEIGEQAEDFLPGPPEDADDASDQLKEWWDIWKELFGGGALNSLHSVRSLPRMQTPLQPPLVAVRDITELKAEQSDLARLASMQSAFDEYFKALGWPGSQTNLVIGSASFQNALHVLRAATAAQQAGTEGGVMITAQEQDRLQTILIGNDFCNGCTNLVQLLNDTVTENQRGRVRRSQGPPGAPNIIDVVEEQAAVRRIVGEMNAEADAGYKYVGDRGKSLVSRMGQALGGFFAGYLPNEEVEPSAENVFPVRIDVFPRGGEQQRQYLNTDALGQLRGLRLPSESVVVVRWLNPASFQIATAFFATGASGSQFKIPQAVWNENTPTLDTDGDGLPDVAEQIVGTMVNVADSDGDGTPDGAEVRAGSNPLDGFVLRPGIIAAVETPGQASDVAVETYDLSAFGGPSSVTRMLVADGTAGLAVMEMVDGQPVLLGQVDTPGDARRVALPGSGTLLGDEVGLGAYTDGAAGFGVVDLSDPVRPRLLHRLTPGGNTKAVTIHGGVVYAGTDGGRVQAVDLFSGEVVDEVSLGYPVHDLKVYLGTLLVAGVSGGQVGLQPIPLLSSGAFGAPGGATGSGGDGTAARRGVRLVTGDGWAYTVYGRGYSSWVITNLFAPQLVAPGMSGQFGWFDLAPNGSGLAVVCVGPNSTDDGPHDVSVYDVRDPSKTDRFVETIVTPGMALSVATHEALAYVADNEAGLQVVQYQPGDRSTNGPQVALRMVGGTEVIAGSRVSLEATAVDDFAVKYVELWVDHQRVAQDHSWPYEFAFQAPVIRAVSGTRMRLQGVAPASFNTNLIVQVRAVDSVGNERFSSVLSLSVVPDTTPPHVARISPEADRVVAGDTPVIVAFDEPLDLASVTPSSVRVESSGADGMFGTVDDAVMSGGDFTFLERANRVVLTFTNRLAAGDYRVAVLATIRDASGNAMGNPVISGFKVRDADLRGGGSFVGEGEFPSVGLKDVYGIQGNAGQKVFFDLQQGGGLGLRWTLMNPAGERVFRELAFFDVATVTLPVVGRYELVLERIGAMDSGYRLQVWNVPSTPAFAVSIGDVIGDGQPGVGAGRIETPGVEDVYTFNAAAGQTVFVDLQDGGSANQRWRLEDATGAVIFNAGFFFDQGEVTLTRGGTYTLTVGNPKTDATGDYRFQIWNVPASQEFAIAMGDTVSDGVPGVGAGRIETPGVTDVYRFTAVPGQVVFFDLQEGGAASTQWRLVDDSGQQVFREGFFFDQGSILLTKGGTYTLTVGNRRTDFAGAYRFRLVNVPAAQSFNIAIGDTVRNGVPLAGAGNLESQGVQDVYTFTATPGQVVFFDLISGGAAATQWRLVDSTGAQVFQEGFFFDPGTVTLTNGGTYTLTIGNPRTDYVSTYSFRILNVPPPTVVPMAFDDTISNGVPVAGAGNIETPGALDVYTFTAAAGQVAVFDLQDGGTSAWSWRLVDDTGVEVFRQGFFFDVGETTLTKGGTYTLTVGNARSDVIGTYRFQMRLVR